MTETVSIKAPHGWGAEIDIRGLGREWDTWSVRGETRDAAIREAACYLHSEGIEGERDVGLGPVELIQDGEAGLGDLDDIMEALSQRAEDGWLGLGDGDCPEFDDDDAALKDLNKVLDEWLARHLATDVWQVAVTEHVKVSASGAYADCPSNCAHLRPVGPSNCVRACAHGARCGSEECRRQREPAAQGGVVAGAVIARTAPSGTPVVVLKDDGSLWPTKTRSAPWELGDGTWVVSLEGRSGGFALERVHHAPGAEGTVKP